MPDEPKKAVKGFLASSQFTSRQVIGMLIPLILDQLFLYVIMLLTTSMISSSSEDSVTAISLVQPLVMIPTMLVTAFGTGGSVLIAQYKGQGDMKRLHEAIAQTTHIVMLLGLILTVLQFLSGQALVNWLFPSATDAVKEKAVRYLSWMGPINYLHCLRVASTAALRGVGEIKRNTVGTIVLNGSYFIFSIIFLNVLKLDITGTLLSYTFARILGTGLSAYYHFIDKRTVVRIQLKMCLKPDWRYLRQIWKLGIPFSLEEVLINLGAVVISVYLVQLGTANVAAHAIINSIFQAVAAPAVATGMLTATIVGQCIGAGKNDLARSYGRRLTLLGYGIVLVSILVVLPIRQGIIAIYHPSAEALVICQKLLWICLGGMCLFYPASQILPNALRASADAKYTTVCSLVSMWAVRVGLGYVAAILLHLDVYGVWMMMAGEWLLRSLLFSLRFRGDKWLAKSENLLKSE